MHRVLDDCSRVRGHRGQSFLTFPPSDDARVGVTKLPIPSEPVAARRVGRPMANLGLLGAEMITFQSIPEAFPIGIAAVLSSALFVIAWRRRAMPMAPAFATMMAGETIWALAPLLSRSSSSSPSSVCASIYDSSVPSPRFLACWLSFSATPGGSAG